MKLLEIYARMKNDIDAIEADLERNVRDGNDNPVLGATSLHLLQAGGKRIRPVFVLLAGQFGNYEIEVLKPVAVSLELIHMATLVHDDVIDDADTRRGRSTVMSKWDSRIAMYTGDYIFARALMVITRLNQPEIHAILSRSIVTMCIGEMEQIRDFFNQDQSVRHYLRRIRRKTALLIAVSCRLGAMAAGAPRDAVRNLYAFGYNVGMAFQIRDDILDICGTVEQLGKPPGSDIRQGNITLPMICALQQPGLRRPLLKEIAKIHAADGEANVEPFLDLIRQSNGIRTAEQLAEQYIQKAMVHLECLHDLQAKRDLADIAAFVTKRSY